MVAPGETQPVQVFLATDFRGRTRIPLTVEELAQVDARLPVAARHLMRGAKEEEFMRANWVRASLALWENGSFDLEDTDDNLYTVVKVNKLVFDELKYPKGVLLNVFIAVLDTCDHDLEGTNTPLTYCRGAAKKTVLVSHDWLDEHYAGWRERLQLLQALGEPPEVLAQQVLVKPRSTPPVNLGNTPFDLP